MMTTMASTKTCNHDRLMITKMSMTMPWIVILLRKTMVVVVVVVAAVAAAAVAVVVGDRW